MHEQLIVANAFTPGAQAINKALRNLDKKKKKVKTATPLVHHGGPSHLVF